MPAQGPDRQSRECHSSGKGRPAGHTLSLIGTASDDDQESTGEGGATWPAHEQQARALRARRSPYAAEGPERQRPRTKREKGREDVGAAGVRSAAAGVRRAAGGSGPGGGRGPAGLRARSGAAPGLRAGAAAAAVPAAGLPGTANTAISAAAVAVPAAVADGTGDAAGDAGASADGCDLPCGSRAGHGGADPGPERRRVPGRCAGRCRAGDDFPRAGADEPASPGSQLTGPALCAHHEQRRLSLCMSMYLPVSR